MRRIFTTVVVVFAAFCGALAQPAAVKNVAKSIFQLTAYDANGNRTSTTQGVFVSSDGKAVCTWSALKDASRAVVTDANGKSYDVSHILGANEIYDLCQISVNVQKASPVSFAPVAATKGGKVWLVELADRKTTATQYEVDKVEKFMDKYAFYVFGYNDHNGVKGGLFVNGNGQAFGVLQQSERSLYANAVDVAFGASLKAATLDVGNSLYANTAIRLALPDEKKDAQLMLMLASERSDTTKYLGYMDDFIAKFPHEVDGYSTRALYKVGKGDFKSADADMQQALKQATDKAEAHSEYARVMYQKLVYSNDTLFTTWTLDKALDEAQKAYSIKPLPAYSHRVAQIKFSKGDYQGAYDMFAALAKTNLRGCEVFFEAAQCKTQLGAPKTEIVALLDSAVAVCPRPLNNVAAPYILARGQMYDQMGDFRKAMVDYNVYDTLMYGNANAEFYFTRYKCEVNLKQYQQALNDIAHAAYVGGNATPLYLAELASLQLRVGLNEDAVKSADLCLQLTPDNTDAYIVKGIAMIMEKKKKEGFECLEKAKELGDDRAEGYMEKYK